MAGPTDRPLVSAIIPAFNAARTIERALESVFAQTRAVDEVIVVDDGSSDRTGEIALCFHPSVQAISAPRNSGAAAARNLGAGRARGDYLAFLDADDQWVPDKTLRQLDALQAGGHGFVASLAEEFDEGGQRLGLLNGGRLPRSGTVAWKDLLARPYLATPSVIVRRALFERVGGFRTELRSGEDQDMWIRLSLADGLVFLPEPLVHVHRTRGSLSIDRSVEDAAAILATIEKHVHEQKRRLTGNERRVIRGARYQEFGRRLYRAGRTTDACRLLMKASLMGRAPFANAWYLVTASALAKAAKKRIGLPDGEP